MIWSISKIHNQRKKTALPFCFVLAFVFGKTLKSVKLNWTSQSCYTTTVPSLDLVSQTEVEAVQLNSGGGLDGGLLFELLLLALGWKAGPGHHVTQGAVGAARKAALQVHAVPRQLRDNHWHRWSGRSLCWQEGVKYLHICKLEYKTVWAKISYSLCTSESCVKQTCRVWMEPQAPFSTSPLVWGFRPGLDFMA